MKVSAFVAILAIVLAGGESAVQKWNENVVALGSSNRSTTVEIVNKATEYVFVVAEETRKSYGRARYTIDVFIDEMYCTTSFTDTEPAYLKFDAESGEVSVATYTKCANITQDNSPSFQFNDGSNLGADKIRVKPVGIKWNNEDFSAKLRAELRITRQIFLGDEYPQMDIHADPEIDYEISVAHDSKFCKANSEFKCAISMTVFSMACDANTKSAQVGLKYITTAGDGVHTETGNICNTYQKQSVESVDTIKFALVGEQKGTFDTRLTVNLQLYSNSSRRCPENHFACQPCYSSYPNTTCQTNLNCIPNSWRCDGRYNCPVNAPNSDEYYYDCKEYKDDGYVCYYSYGYSGWSLAWGLLTLFFILTGIIVSIRAAKTMCLSRRVARPRAAVRDAAYPIKDNPPSYVQATGSA